MEYSRSCRARTIRRQRLGTLRQPPSAPVRMRSRDAAHTEMRPRLCLVTLLLLLFTFLQPSFHNSFDVVLSDMAPSTSGIKMLDANSSHELCQHALDIAHKVLKPNGTLIMVGQKWMIECGNDTVAMQQPDQRC